MLKKKFLPIYCLFLFSPILFACSPKYSNKTVERKVHIFAVRQLPQPLVYNRVKTVHLASPLPSREKHPVSNKIITPVFQFEAEDSTLGEVVMILANTAKYSAYCDKQLENIKISLITLGTVEEIANEIEKDAGITVDVDHVNKEIRFLANHSKERLLKGE